jgi:thiamine-monophosphate kinase
MKISELGGEFSLIRRLTRGKPAGKHVIRGIGDDCAVIKYTKDQYQLITTDMMVEGDHFSLDWYSPYQVGMKLMEVNVSDIVSMGGTPAYAFISLCLPGTTTVEFMDEFYKGLYASAARYGVHLLGGDTTHGRNYVFNLTLLGHVPKNLLRLRSGAKKGDLICVTGTLGGSTAGLRLLQQGLEGYTDDHLNPRSRTTAEAARIARLAHAMIDVSDGLASEVTHICNESNCGACIHYDTIPLSAHTLESARLLDEDPREFALYGGEDFELVFTLRETDIPELKKQFTDFTVVGHIAEKKTGVYLLKNGQKQALKGGYNHFCQG